jgi:hypothetical protein
MTFPVQLHIADHLTLLEELDARQDELLTQLDELDRRLEATLQAVAKDAAVLPKAA